MSITSHPLTQQIYNAVVHNPHVNHRKMHFRAESGRVTIRGTVHSFFEKQMAQEALRKIEGVRAIENQLEVSWS